MKRITLSLIFLGMVCWLYSQETKTYNAGSAKNVEIFVEQSELDISTYNGTDILIETDNYQPPPERAKGLKSLYSEGPDNTGLGLTVDKNPNGLMIRKASSRGINFRIKVPAQTSLKITETGWWGGGFKISGVKGEIEITANNSNIELLKVSGPIVASSTSGNITITMAEVNQNKPSAISNISGFIDLSLPSTTKANLELKAMSGEIYSDLDLEMDTKSKLPRIGGSDINSKLNGGGVAISLNTISSDIYLRKQ